MNIRVRFAPSPTGPLHIGSIRTALYNYLFAKKYKGTFILRIEDTDKNRFIARSIPYILQSLKWLQIEPDEGLYYGGEYYPYQQSKRKHIYIEFIQYLLYYGYAYYAFDSSKDLNKCKQNNSFLYNHLYRNNMCNSLSLSPQEVAHKIVNKILYVIRFKMPKNRIIHFYDSIRGHISIKSDVLEDKILMKSDGTFTYHFVNVVDDFLMKITHVIRGEEWISSTPLHILLYEAFNWPLPNFIHLPLIMNPNGKGKISKRNLNLYNFPIFPLTWRDDITGVVYPGFKELGYLPKVLLNYLFILGLKNVKQDIDILSLKEMQNNFKLTSINNSNIQFNIDKLQWINKQYLKLYSIRDISIILHKELLLHKIYTYKDDYLNKIIVLIKNRITLLKDIWFEAKYFFLDPIIYHTPYKDKLMFNNMIITCIIEVVIPLIEGIIKFTSYDLQSIIYAHIKVYDIKLVIQNLRLAIVGALYGISIFMIMEVIGRIRTINRLKLYIKYLQK